jgi:DNA segregation ATPase FtsK/SpoIIIE, S-DNA-T family
MDSVEKLNLVLNSFKIAANCKKFSEYKNTCSYDIELKPGARIRDFQKYINELALTLRIPGKPSLHVLNDEGLLRFEFIKARAEKINLFQLGYGLPRPTGNLTALLGESPQGEPIWMDLVDNPHLLIAGASGSGKSTLLHNLIANLLLHPKTSIVLMDPKNIEFYKYVNMKSDRIKVHFDFQDCLAEIESLAAEMDERYRVLRELRVSPNYFPYIVLMIDEFASLIQQDDEKRFHRALCKLSQKSRAANIHIVISTQRPSVDVLDGTIKANFPARIACKVSSGIDSRIVLGANGAQELMGYGDAIIQNVKYDLQRFQIAFTSPEEVNRYFGSNG